MAGIEVLKARMDLLWAEVEEADLVGPFLDHLDREYDLIGSEIAIERAREEMRP